MLWLPLMQSLLCAPALIRLNKEVVMVTRTNPNSGVWAIRCEKWDNVFGMIDMVQRYTSFTPHVSDLSIYIIFTVYPCCLLYLFTTVIYNLIDIFCIYFSAKWRTLSSKHQNQLPRSLWGCSHEVLLVAVRSDSLHLPSPQLGPWKRD